MKYFRLAVLILMLSSCVHVQLPDGSSYTRFGDQKLDGLEVVRADGSSLILNKQESTADLLGTLAKIGLLVKP